MTRNCVVVSSNCCSSSRERQLCFIDARVLSSRFRSQKICQKWCVSQLTTATETPPVDSPISSSAVFLSVRINYANSENRYKISTVRRVVASPLLPIYRWFNDYNSSAISATKPGSRPVARCIVRSRLLFFRSTGR